MKEPIVYSNGQFTVALYGPRNTIREARELAVIQGADADKICAIKAASDHTHPGFREIVPPKYGDMSKEDFDIWADGTILTGSNSAAIMFTAGCLSSALYEHSSHKLIWEHCGRPATTPSVLPDGGLYNIVTEGLKLLTRGVESSQLLDLEAYLTGSICPECFKHDHPDAQHLITPFDVFGDLAFTDRGLGKLDLKNVVTKQLKDAGVLEKEIRSNELCTAETPWLADFRTGEDKNARNVVIAVLH